jgi:hypothetical protein
MAPGGSSAAGWLSIAALVALAVAIGACDDEPPDPALATPKATAMTLLRAHHLDRMPADEIRRRMSRTDEGRFGAVDQPLVARCFTDFDDDDPVDHGLVGFLVGILAARRDELEVRVEGARAVVSAGPAGRVVMHHESAGWKISIEESVPRSYRERMQGLYDRALKKQ